MIALSKRQANIFIFLYKNIGNIIPINKFTTDYSLSKRSIQIDFKRLKQICQKNGMLLNNIPKRGYTLIIIENNKAKYFYDRINYSYVETYKFESQPARIIYIINKLINNSYIKSQNLSDELCISKSRVSDDLKIVREKIESYNLILDSKPNYGLFILGDEEDKRICLAKECLNFNNSNFDKLPFSFFETNVKLQNKISDIVTSICSSSKLQISDIVLQNLIIHVFISVKRMLNNHYIENMNNSTIVYNEHSKRIAVNIIKECVKIFKIEYYQSEVNNLALIISSKRNYDNEKYLTEYSKNLVTNALNKIKDLYAIDLTNEIELIISLGLHIVPLKMRIINNMQYQNMTKLNIKKAYPLSYNISCDFLNYIFPKDTCFTDDEVYYIATHFIQYVEEKISTKNPKKILIITSSRANDTILMRKRIKINFPEVSSIDVISINYYEKSKKVKNFNHYYTTILTTEKKIAEENETIRYISYFINERDLKKIDFGLLEINSIQHIIRRFSKDLFYFGNSKNKKTVLDLLIKKANTKYNLNSEFRKSIIKHEKATTSSYFGNGIAMPHPEELITDDTFVCFAFLKNAIEWDNGYKINIVLLVSIESGKPQALRLWHYLSILISNPLFYESKKEIRSFDMLVEIIRKVYKDYF